VLKVRIPPELYMDIINIKLGDLLIRFMS